MRRRGGRGRLLWWLLVVAALVADLVVAVVHGSATIDGNGAAAVKLENSTLVFTPSRPVSFQIGSHADLTWTITDIGGTKIQSGTARGSSAPVVVTPSSTLPQGLYSLALATPGHDPVTAQFMVIGQAPPLDTYFGVATHHKDPAAAVPLLSEMGLGMARSDTSWSAFEQQPGVVETPSDITDWVRGAQQTGARTIWTVGYGNPLYQNGQEPVTDPSAVTAFTDYVNDFLQQNPSIRYIEVYNEFNRQVFNNSGCRTGTCYASLLKAVYTAVKPKHPDVTIIGGGYGGYSTSWFTDLFEAGGFKYADAWSYHPYAMTPSKLVQTVDSLNQLQGQYDDGTLKPIFFSELGWASVASQQGLSGLRVDSQAQQAYRMVADFIAPMARSNVEGMAWYDLFNDTNKDADNTNSNFGMFISPTSSVAAYQPKEAAYAFYYMREQLVGYQFDSSSQSNGVLDYTFRNSSGKTMHVLFKSDLSQLDNTSSATATVQVSGVGRSAQVTTATGQKPSGVTANTAGGGVTVRVGDAPVFVSGS